MTALTTISARDETKGQCFDALDRPLSQDWLRACAQAREARLIRERAARKAGGL